MSNRKFVKAFNAPSPAEKNKLALAAAKAARKAARAASGPTQMDFEMAVKKAVMKEKAKDAGFVDRAVTTLVCDTTGTIVLAATVAQGVSVNQRIGKKAVWKSIQMRGNVSAGTAGVVAEAALMLVYDRKPTAALPAITDILVTANSNAFLNDVNSDRFQIVRRWDWVVIGDTTAPQTGREAYTCDEYIDLKKRPVEFNAAGTGAIGDIAKGALYWVSVGTLAAGTTAPNIVMGNRTRFIDVEG